MDNQQKILDISWLTIVRFIIAAIIIYFLFIVKDLAIDFIFAVIISILFNPAINFLEKKKLPRVLASIIVYFGIFILLGLFVYLTAPMLFSELRDFAMKFPEYFETASPYLKGLQLSALANFQSFTQALENMLAKTSSSFFNALGSIFGGIITTIAIFSISFFLSLEEKGIEKSLAALIPNKYRQKALDVWSASQRKVSVWFGTRVLGMLFIGIITTITCYCLGIKYAIFFGLLAGLSDLIPTIGPLVAGAVIAMFVLVLSLPKALLFVIIFILMQQIENHVLIPILSKKFLKLSPALVLMAVLIGSRIWGILGSILAIPLMAMLFEVIKGIWNRNAPMVQNIPVVDDTTQADG
ncbi:MAG: AI-2E family transporter [Candidatus Pacebacteria bacterium]|nr:AI-2E family transporter [Candidatus Paceibacterota bacterium]